MTEHMQLDSESGLLVSGVLHEPPCGETAAAEPLHRRVRRWLKRQTAPRVEDEVVGAGWRRPPVRLVLPLVIPVLLVPAILLVREPENLGAFVGLVGGAFAIAYAALADWSGGPSASPTAPWQTSPNAGCATASGSSSSTRWCTRR
jgi:hypothetical protein